MDANRIEHLEQLNRDIQKWLQEADRLDQEGQKPRAEIIRGWAKNAGRLCERIKVLPSN
jgi:3-phenylpropionate/cinnamic acid dioxygenase small subunit